VAKTKAKATPKTKAKAKAKAKPKPKAKAEPDDAETFAHVREQVERQLAKDYHHTDTSWFYALARLGHSDVHGDAARELLLGGWQRLIDVKREKNQLINSVAYHALAYAAIDLPPHPSIGPALQHAFRVAGELTDLEVHYNANVACGALAVACASIDYREILDDIAKFRERFDHYDGTAFHTQVLYAQWMLTEDAAGANKYLAESDQLKVLGWPAAALADLDHKPGRSTIFARLSGRLYAESREALLEASARLRTQDGAPAAADRMFRLFGRVSPVEIALGNENDDTFRDRAVAKRNG
jgi:hypothetical protein